MEGYAHRRRGGREGRGKMGGQFSELDALEMVLSDMRAVPRPSSWSRNERSAFSGKHGRLAEDSRSTKMRACRWCRACLRDKPSIIPSVHCTRSSWRSPFLMSKELCRLSLFDFVCCGSAVSFPPSPMQ